MDDEKFQILEFFRRNWPRKSTLLILVLLLIGFLLWVFSGIDLKQVTQNEIFFIFAIVLIAIVFWLYSNSPPKSSKGKIGFAIGIKTDNPEQHQKIKRDFIDTLRTLLYKSKYKHSFQFIELPDRFVEKIGASPDAAIKMLNEIGCSFMVYGKARTTTLKNQIQHVLDMDGLVAHKPIPQEISKTFSMEFASLFPKRKMISSEGDLFEFEVTASWIDILSKYIIGIASLISGDFEYSQELFESLQAELKEKKTEIPAIVKIRDRLPTRLRDVYLIRVQLCYEDWIRTKDIYDIEKMKPLLDSLNAVAPENYDVRIFRSLWYFVVQRDIAKAKSECVKGKNKKNIAWRYNYAFLFAYEGDLERAVKEYKQAFQGYYLEPSFPFNIVDFILWVLDVEPDKTQLHFCLGLIYYHVINDLSLASQGFERFIELTDSDLYSSQRVDAEKMIAKINGDSKSGKVARVE